MGVLFIAAGSSSKNREKTLERPHTLSEIDQFLQMKEREYLKSFFPDGQGVYLWGANPKNFDQLSQVRKGEYAVDVKNKKVIQVFHYCFFIETADTRLQEFVGWDREKAKSDRRPYKYVYFLKSPLSTRQNSKEYFQSAFNQGSNQNWLVGQKYFNDIEISSALQRTSSASLESFLGIDSSKSAYIPQITPPTPVKPTTVIVRKPAPPNPQPSFETPVWLKDHVSKVKVLKQDQGHLERDHEDLVAGLFEILGYERTNDIKFRRGNIDIRIEKEGQPLITIEVKADWSLSTESKRALGQAFNYANETGTPFVIITNGDKYCIYDRRQGLSYKDAFVSDVSLTYLTESDITLLNKLRKENIK